MVKQREKTETIGWTSSDRYYQENIDQKDKKIKISHESHTMSILARSSGSLSYRMCPMIWAVSSSYRKIKRTFIYVVTTDGVSASWHMPGVSDQTSGTCHKGILKDEKRFFSYFCYFLYMFLIRKPVDQSFLVGGFGCNRHQVSIYGPFQYLRIFHDENIDNLNKKLVEEHSDTVY